MDIKSTAPLDALQFDGVLWEHRPSPSSLKSLQEASCVGLRVLGPSEYSVTTNSCRGTSSGLSLTTGGARFQPTSESGRWSDTWRHARRRTTVAATHVEILCWIDDHSRYALSVTTHRRVTATIVLTEFRKTVENHGIPYSTLTDNGMVFTTRLAGGKGGRNQLEAELRRLDITQINSTPNHPTTCGKVERFHQTLKKALKAGARATTLDQLQTQPDAFIDEYNHRRPHRSLPHQATPATIYTARPKADPATRFDTHNRVRTDRVGQAGSITLRVNGRLHQIGVGRIHYRTRVLILVQDHNIKIINAATGDVLRDFTLDPTSDYQPTGAPKGPTRKKPQT